MFIVSEIGVNWNGDFELAKFMMNESKRIGCNAVKFQSYEPKILQNHKDFELLKNCTITENNVSEINKISKQVGIEWFSTPMFPEAISFLNPYVKRFKIREFDGRLLLENKLSPLLEQILETNKEIIVSSQLSPKNSQFATHDLIKWLYCVPKYPSMIEDHNFKNFDDFDGFSNHSPNPTIPLISAILGGNILEIHVTEDKNKNYVDNNVSYTFDELSELINQIRDIQKVI